MLRSRFGQFLISLGVRGARDKTFGRWAKLLSERRHGHLEMIFKRRLQWVSLVPEKGDRFLETAMKAKACVRFHAAQKFWLLELARLQLVLAPDARIYLDDDNDWLVRSVRIGRPSQKNQASARGTAKRGQGSEHATSVGLRQTRVMLA